MLLIKIYDIINILETHLYAQPIWLEEEINGSTQYYVSYSFYSKDKIFS